MSLPTPTWLEEAMKKYKRMLNHVRLRPIYSVLIPKITDKTAVAQAQTSLVREKVQKILEQEGVFSDFHPSYYAYAYALDKSQRTLAFMVDLIREHTILRDRWESRGLNPDILDKLDAVLIFRKS